MVTMDDVALKAGVSQTTVSSVLGGRADRLKISHQTRERVLGAAQELGYQRNQLARAMVTGKSRIIGLLLAPYSSENVVRILSGATEMANAKRYLLKVVYLPWDNIDDETIAVCLEWRLAGAMVVGFSEGAHRRLNEAFRKSNIPVTLIDNVPPVNWGVRIGSNDEQGIRQVVSYLLALGHREIAFIGGRPSPLSDWRERSFRAALAEAGLSVPAHWVRNTAWGEQKIIKQEAQALFEESGSHLPTAIMCSADSIAMVVMHVAHAHGLRVPHDLSVTGYSNTSLAAFADPPLTTVDQSFQEMGRLAARQLIGLAENKDMDEFADSGEILLPVQMIERESTAAAPIR